MTRRNISVACLFLAIFCASLQVEANFFSRLAKFGDDKKKVDPDGTSPPAGALAAMGSEAQVGSVITFEDGVVMAHLANNNKVPLVGVGVGNAPYKTIKGIVSEAIQDDKKTRLIDTSHASNNEKLVAEGILDGVSRMNLGQGESVQIHVVTKVWYTHLGYGRTKLAVEESLKALRKVMDHDKIDLHLHVLLQWPRCFENIPWMNCKKEEAELPSYVKEAGLDPSSDPDGSLRDSWKLLEEMYLSDKYPIASIGISNFHLHDIEKMDSFVRIKPHVLQVNIWSLLYDAPLIEYCHKHRIHVQVYNTMQGTLVQPGIAPRALHHLQKVAYDVGDKVQRDITPAQILFAWLIQHGVSIIPRTSDVGHLKENSAITLSSLPGLDDLQVETVAHAVEAYLSQEDMEQDLHVSVSFHAVNKDLMIYWLGREGDQDGYIALVRKGDIFNETTYPNHIFRTYEAQNKDNFVDHKIQGNFGDHKSIRVEL
jgi:diketogulonate reductase-like aldo/keto reductase